MAEEPDQPFPPPEDTAVNNVSTTDETEPEATQDEPLPEETTVELNDYKKPPEHEDYKAPIEEQPAHAHEEGPAHAHEDRPAQALEDRPARAPEAKTAPSPLPEDESEPHDSAIHASSSTGSDGETTGPSTAENSVSHAPDEPKLVVGGRASIPDELEPHQLACLQNLKESNA